MKILDKKILGLGLGLALASNAALAEEHIVKAVVTNWQPMITVAKVGDTVTFTNMNGHNSVSLKGMIPEGAQPWESPMGQKFTYTLDKPGIYIYKCQPHAAMGMEGAIIVGEGKPANLDAAKAAAKTTKDAPKGFVKRVIKKAEKELKKRGWM